MTANSSGSGKCLAALSSSTLAGSTSAMRLLVWFVLLASMALAEVEWTTESRKTYCNMIFNRWIYKQERLDWYCQLKVWKVDDQV